MKISKEFILSEWEKDSVINPDKISTDSINVGHLHSKYIRYLFDCKERYIILDARLSEIRRTKTRYYKGEMSKIELDERGWNQYQGPRLTKSAISEILVDDEDIVDVRIKMETVMLLITTLESIIKTLHSRSFDIKNHVEYVKFVNGGN